MVHIRINRQSDIPAALLMAGKILLRDSKRKLAQIRQEKVLEAIKRERAELNQ